MPGRDALFDVMQGDLGRETVDILNRMNDGIKSYVVPILFDVNVLDGYC